MDKARMKNILLDLCEIPSISETEGEHKMAQKLYDLLSEVDYFRRYKEHLYKISLKNDIYGRSFVAALLKGQPGCGKTVILLSHYDVVAVEDFGALKKYAFNPLKYTEMLRESAVNLPDEAYRDLMSGDYLFGRGTMDMKFGIALDIEILHEVSRNLENFPGNILFLSVPDEEANSAGMTGAVEFLNELKEEHSLDYACCIVSEPHFPKFAGDKSNYIYSGTVGKLLPVFYCIGKETHAGEPFSGLNPNLLTAKLIEKIEQNPDLCESHRGCTTPAPVCLKSSDTKNEYSVQIPTAAYAYFNYVTLNKTPLEVMETFKAIAIEAFEEVLHGVRLKADKLRNLTGDALQLPGITPRVYTYSELYRECINQHGNELKKHLREFMQNAKINDARQLSIEVVKELCKYSPVKEPMIVLFYAPPYYPACSGLDSYPIVNDICRQVIRQAESQFGERLELQPYFTGLSDMSYLGLPNSMDADALAADFPLWGSKYSLPVSTMSKLNIPFINIGPLGKDAHKYTERLCMPFSFEISAKLVMDAVTNIILDKI